MNLPALVRSSQQDGYTSLTILGCTVNCRFRFADCPLIYCDFIMYEFDDWNSKEGTVNWLKFLLFLLE